MPKGKEVKNKIDWLRLIFSIALCQLAGVVGAFFTTPSIPSWYKNLIKPEFSPPNWVFGPVWTIIFTLMGISFYLVWRAGLKKKEVRTAVYLFLLHLLVNIFWSIAFFGLKNPLLGLADIILLWLLILLLSVKFGKVNSWAAVLLVPYLLWVSFATVLNYKIWILNS